MPKVRPKPQAPAPVVPRELRKMGAFAKSNVPPMTKHQEHFEDQANVLAAQFGWDGEPSHVVYDIRIEDARNFFRKTLHEVHIAAVSEKTMPDAGAVAAHLGMDAEDTAELAKALKAMFDAEVEEHKALPLGEKVARIEKQKSEASLVMARAHLEHQKKILANAPSSG